MKAGAVVCLWLGLLLGEVASTASADPRTDYTLDCRGCHGAGGAGVPGKVPDMRNSLVPLSLSAAGRRYLVEVPGVAQAPLSDLELAQLLNWITRHLSAVPEPTGFEPFTAHEVASYRKTPLVAVAALRQRLLTGSPRSASSRQ
jgi:hypothetical protein